MKDENVLEKLQEFCYRILIYFAQSNRLFSF